MKLKVTTLSGIEHIVEFVLGEPISNLHSKIQQILEPNDLPYQTINPNATSNSISLSELKVIHVQSGKVIHLNDNENNNNNNNNANVNFNDNDTLVIIKKRSLPPPETVDTTLVPTSNVILAATRDKSLATPPDSSSEIKEQLQDLMGLLLGLASPPSSPSQSGREIGSLISLFSNNISPPPPSQPVPTQQPQPTPTINDIPINAVALESLRDMGFPESQAKKALILCKMNLHRAMEWILEHKDDPNIDDPLTEEQITQVQATQGVPTPIRAPAPTMSNSQMAQQLTEMGFNSDDANAALRATNYNFEQATAWLLGDRVEEDEGDQNEGGVDSNSPMLRLITSNPIIQAGLGNPRVEAAFQEIIRNPAASLRYLSDPEVGPILLQVFNIVNTPTNNNSM